MTMGIHGYCSEQVITDKFITPLYKMFRSGNIYFHITVDEYQYLREFVLRNVYFATKNLLYSTPYSQCPPRFQHLAAEQLLLALCCLQSK